MKIRRMREKGIREIEEIRGITVFPGY